MIVFHPPLEDPRFGCLFRSPDHLHDFSKMTLKEILLPLLVELGFCGAHLEVSKNTFSISAFGIFDILPDVLFLGPSYFLILLSLFDPFHSKNRV